MVKIHKARELRDMSDEQLRKRLADIHITQMKMRGVKEAGGATNPGVWRNIRKEKARILTILRERELGIRQ